MLTLIPSEIALRKPCIKLDIAKKIDQFEMDSKKYQMCFDYFRVGSSQFNIKFCGEVSTNGISVNEFDGVQNYSIGFVFADEEDIEGITALENVLADFLTLAFKDHEEWTIVSPVKDDKIYFKLKQKDGKNSFKSNIAIDLQKPENALIHIGENIDVTTSAAYYFHFGNKKCGVSLSPKTLVFEELKKPTKKR